MTTTEWTKAFSPTDLLLDPKHECDRITSAIRQQVGQTLRRKGVVLGLSGGVDSSVTAALCVRALGDQRVFGILMPERDSSPDSLQLGQELAGRLGIETILEDVTETLTATGCYRRRDDAIRKVFPAFNGRYKSKIVLPSLFQGSAYRIFSIVIQSSDGKTFRKRMPLGVYQEVVAATNFKQRVRKMMEYYHADRLRYAVAGTPNLLEYDQGFYVKNGDGAADLKPIAHLYKTQVYQLADYLELPQSIRGRTPTTDTYSLEQTQEEFFFSLPYDQMDICLYGKNNRIPCDQIAESIGLDPRQIQLVYADIDAKRRSAAYLSAEPLTVV